MQIYIDGGFYSESEAKISVFDHGLLYGDGVFEGIRFLQRQGLPFGGTHGSPLQIGCGDWIEHPTRLIRSDGSPPGDRPSQRAHRRLHPSRGDTRQRRPGPESLELPKPTIIIIAAKITLYPQESYEKGLKVVTCATRRIAHGALSPMVKSLNYLNNIMAKIEASHAGAGEGLMLNEQGLVAECTGDNIFVVSGGKITTPPISSGALAGVTRAVAIQIAGELGLEVSEPQMTRYDIYTADECFLTGTAAEIIPAVELDNRPIGNGNQGPSPVV